MKASPSLEGVVIGKKLFARAVKTKQKRSKEKDEAAALDAAFVAKAEELKDRLLEKLFYLVNGKTSQGVFNDLGEEIIPKGRKHTQKGLKEIEDYTHLVSGGWTTDDHTNELINEPYPQL